MLRPSNAAAMIAASDESSSGALANINGPLAVVDVWDVSG
jgi:hypothetical protein